jgi:dTDP-4-amino-4,6-dideoxygalactose transaminase
VNPQTHTIDPRHAAQLITPRTTALVGVHLWGRGCDVEALAELAGEHRLSLLFDAAHAFGCTHQGRPIGGFGDCEVFSFHATKFLHCGEGGAVTTNDDDLARRLRLMRNFGFAGMDHVASLGINGKMSEFAAAVGLTSLDHKARIVAANRGNYDSYRRLLAPLPGLKLLPFDPREENNYQYVVVEVDEAEAGLTRDELVAVLFADNVLARRYFYPGCHRTEPYCSASGEPHVRLPATESLARSVFALPTGMQLDERAITTIVELLETAIANAAMVRGRLRQRRAA